MSYAEDTLAFDCEGATLQGIVAKPTVGQAVSNTGVVIIVGGPQYRAGSHRQFVLLARHLAARGYPTLRFDYRGMGDSESGDSNGNGGELHDFLTVERDIDAAIQAFQSQQPGLQQFVLWGLCDGASAALLALRESTSAPIVGLCLLNPWVRSEAGLARAHVTHYYLQRVGERDFWLKLLKGGIAGTAILGLMNNLRLASRTTSRPEKLSFQTCMAQALKSFKGATLMILSGSDLTAQEFVDYSSRDAQWQGVLSQQSITLEKIAGADHTFSDFDKGAAVNTLTAAWLDAIISERSHDCRSC